MTHDPSYVDTLTSEEQIRHDFVTGKGNGSHISLLRLLQSGLTMAQVERYVEDEVQQHYLQLIDKSNYIQLWDKVYIFTAVKVFMKLCFFCNVPSYLFTMPVTKHSFFFEI